MDGTLGGGGHSRQVLQLLSSKGRLIALDRDEEALERAKQSLAEWKDKLTLVHSSFANIEEVLMKVGVSAVDGIIMDLGLSSDQLDSEERGFSFMRDALPDMRMDLSKGVSAAEWLEETPKEEMSRVFKVYGEERMAWKIAKAIERSQVDGPIKSTEVLAEIISKAKGGRRGKIHPATKVFQAIRIAVNDEMGHLERGLDQSFNCLSKGGRLGVITFHSLEDRMVKHKIREHEGRMESLHEGGERWEGKEPRMMRITRKPILATEEEVKMNPRSRSAKLRVAEKI